jgi:hypothetical protein
VLRGDGSAIDRDKRACGNAASGAGNSLRSGCVLELILLAGDFIVSPRQLSALWDFSLLKVLVRA